ncbi:hypothetical protein [Aliarcobacter butzleri]|uniref:hypothetical protein n=1 Tax=Aliarcobacter butzleri TaxID=28197 RepID=UPI0021B324C8|nr:hypothetical protein [Aliarcobacter butzleri]UXC28594.1 hypothetical protein N3114_07885 [Aliarcobacter butzleri]UXC29203.1 hypothetical protein N3114_11185 [Aliarcobacter butzleri]
MLGRFLLTLFFSVVFIFILLKACSGSDKTKNNYDDEKWREQAWNEKGKDAIRTKLKDASSAQFRNVFFNNNGVPVSCGEVNSKNSFGGYSGYQSYVYAGNIVVLEEEVEGGITQVWNEFCVKPNKDLENNLKNTLKEGTPFTINSDSAKYFIIEKSMKVDNNKNLRTIITKRVGSSGIYYTKRIYDCKKNTFKTLGEGDTLEKMKNSKGSEKMIPLVVGSVAYEFGLELCK